MANVFTVSLGPPSTWYRRVKFKLIRRLPAPWRFHLERRATDRLYERLTRKATDAEEKGRLSAEWGFESELVENAFANYVTWKLIDQAHRLLLPTPRLRGKEDENWYQSPTNGRYVLTAEAITALRRAIRDERRARREPWQFRAPILFGLAGMLIGLLGVLVRR